MSVDPSLRVRVLEEGDYDRGVLQLLAQLTVVGDVSRTAFCARVRQLAGGPEHVMVVEGGPDGPLLACGTLLLERKLVHACGCCGHVEDVVVDSAARGRGVGKLLLSSLVDVARSHGCYKVILDCSPDNAAFYQQCGFARKELQMRLDL